MYHHQKRGTEDKRRGNEKQTDSHCCKIIQMVIGSYVPTLITNTTNNQPN